MRRRSELRLAIDDIRSSTLNGQQADKVGPRCHGPVSVVIEEQAGSGEMHQALFQKLQGQYYQFKHGYFEPQIWITRRNRATGLLELLRGRAGWDQEVQAPIYSPECASIITGAPSSGFKVKLAGLEG